jgi:hypothetical protein
MAQALGSADEIIFQTSCPDIWLYQYSGVVQSGKECLDIILLQYSPSRPRRRHFCLQSASGERNNSSESSIDLNESCSSSCISAAEKRQRHADTQQPRKKLMAEV